MSKFLRRAASVVLALSLAAGLVPAGISDLIGLPKTEVRADDDVVEITTLDQMNKAFQNGGNCKLMADIEVVNQSSYITISNDLVLDLNGKKLVHDRMIQVYRCTFTIRDSSGGNGEIYALADDKDSFIGAIIQPYGGTLRLEGGKLTADYAYYPVSLPNQLIWTSRFEMTGGTVNSGTYGAVYVDGAGTNTTNYYEISGGTVNGELNDRSPYTPNYSIEITGGRFINKPNDSYLPAGYEFIGPDDDYYTVSHVACDITLEGGTDHATVSGGAVTQTGVTGEMDAVTYTASEGYHFDEYSVTENGITVERTSETTIRVSGIPTADVTLQIPEAQADSYTPLLRMRADSARVILDVYLPYDGSQNLYAEWDENQVTLQTTEIDGKSYGYFSITSAAKNMVDDHKLVVMLDQQAVCNKTFSMVDYLTRVIELSSSESDPYRAAAIAMIRYASAAQLVFNYPTGVQENTPAIANYGIPEAQLSTLNDVVVPDTTPVSEIASVFDGLRYSTYYGMNMTHTYDTVLLIAFRVNEGAGATIGTAVQEVRRSYFPNESLWTVTADSTRHYVIVRINVGVRAMETSVYTYTRVPGNIETRILPSDYLGRISADSSRNMNLRYLCRALYLYYQAAVNIPAN